MKHLKALCLALVMLLAVGGCLAEAGEELSAQIAEQPVEEVELSLGEAPIDAEGEIAVSAAEEESVPEAAEQDAQAPDEAGEAPTVEPEPTATPAPKVKKIVVPKKLTIGVKEKVQLEPVVEPEDAGYEKITYKSSKTKYAKVSKKGVITGKKKGKTTITVKAGGVKAKVKVTVKKAPKKITLKAEKKRLMIGEKLQLKAKLPSGTAGSYSYSVKPKGIVKVSEDGLVTAKKAGTAKVTVTTYNGKKDTVELTVMPKFEITFMDIGRNDGILIQCGGEYAFIDSGMHGQGVTAVKYMKSMEVDHLKYYIGTHAHRDHIGGAPAILAAFPTEEVIVSHSGTARKIRDFAENDAERKAVKEAKYRVVKAGDTFKLGKAKFKVLGPIRILNVDTGSNAENANSLVMKLTFGKSTFLLTGDASGSELTDIEKANPGCMKVKVLKNPHHNGAQRYAVDKCKPYTVVFSTSSSSLPSAQYLSYIKSKGAKYYITAPNRNGHVTMSSDGKKIKVKTQK